MAKFCQNCGAKLDDGVKFCDSCGAAVESEIQTVQTVQAQTQPASGNSIIQVFRKWRFVGCIMADKVYVDGIKIGTVSNGQSTIFEVQPGVHQLQLKMNWNPWIRSAKFDFKIEHGQKLKFNCDYTFGTFATICGWWMLKTLFSGFKIIKIESAV